MQKCHNTLQPHHHLFLSTAKTLAGISCGSYVQQIDSLFFTSKKVFFLNSTCFCVTGRDGRKNESSTDKYEKFT
jgi:hypothetical protein